MRSLKNGDPTKGEAKRQQMIASGQWKPGPNGELLRVEAKAPNLGFPSKERMSELEGMGQKLTEAEAREYVSESFNPSSNMNALFSLIAGAGFDPLGDAVMKGVGAVGRGARSLVSTTPKAASKPALKVIRNESTPSDVITTGRDKEKVFPPPSPEKIAEHNAKHPNNKLNERGLYVWRDNLPESEQRKILMEDIQDLVDEQSLDDDVAQKHLQQLLSNTEELYSAEGKSNLLDFDAHMKQDLMTDQERRNKAFLDELMPSPFLKPENSSVKELARHFNLVDRTPLNMETSFPNTQVSTRVPEQYYRRNNNGGRISGVLPKVKVLKR